METIDELVAFLQRALQDGARNRLVDTGEAWSIMRQGGITPDDAPPFRATLDADLAEYGFAVLDAALALKFLDRQHPTAREGFAMAGRVFEALIRNGDPDDSHRGFHRVMAAAAFHLGSYAAIAYTLFATVDAAEQNLNAAETCLISLLLRDMAGIRDTAQAWLQYPQHEDEVLAAAVAGDGDRDDILSLILNGTVCRALAIYEFALRTGVAKYVADADSLLSAGYEIAGDAGLVSLWWVIRITQHLLNDLWSQSLHEVIPLEPSQGDGGRYLESRTLFIASLFAKDTAHIELWPSQIKAARRAADPDDDLVVALPTSAGKTRVAELAALVTLAMGKRILIVTPLRALSAQTERSFRSTFAPLGASVSSLYGKSGMPAGDADALRSYQVVVSTPEKLDFALRSDPDVIADIGLIVLDEGHMIGPGDREVRYEILVQRLLRRADAGDRRIICLSAILPQGDVLNDMTAWIRSDAEGEAVRSEWRPSRQRYGTLEWSGTAATLRYDLYDNGPFVSQFIEELEPIKPDRKPYPRDVKDVALMAAWRFAEEGKRTLIYVTQANWVEGYGERATQLVEKGYLPSLLQDAEAIGTAITIGTEWLGADHPAVDCLRVGVAVHHGKLPSPFLREVERLLSSGAIKVTATSPTLAQGLNLNAAVLLAPYLVRKGTTITGEEFANVAGRAGRAFVDTEGLILHVIKDKHARRRAEWARLVTAVKERTLRSGLRIVIDQVVKRLAQRGVARNEAGYEYLTNAREAWLEEPEDAEGEPLEDLVAKLDAIVFGLIEALDADAGNLPALLDEALAGSLWARQMDHLRPGVKRMQMIVLETRARLIWNTTTAAQRRGHFAMGVGLDTGLRVDEMADVLASDIDQADLAALQGDLVTLHQTLVGLADRLLSIKPFIPDARNALVPGWQDVLGHWLSGASVAAIGGDHIGIVEDAFVYRLVWALEAVRTRRFAGGWTPEDGTIPGAAAACLDTGLPDYRMTLLVRAGLASREAARRVIQELEPEFFDGSGMRDWLLGKMVAELSNSADWPTAGTAPLWQRFRDDILKGKEQAWTDTTTTIAVARIGQGDDPARQLVRVEPDPDGGPAWVTTPDFRPIARLERPYPNDKQAVVYADLDFGVGAARIRRIGPHRRR